MGSSYFEGVVLDPSKCSKLSMEEKRELVYELSKWSHGAPEMLQSWSRQEILQVLCAEMGKERKYTGLTKLKIIEILLKIVAEKKSQGHEMETSSDPHSSPAVGQRAFKRQRKLDNPNRLSIAVNNDESDISNTIYCKNSACRAKLSQQDAFCKRCSCCICHQYDDNKDPSLWLTCNSEPPYQGDACGMSCHLECALRHEKSGIAKDGMDGRFCCLSCGKVNDLLGCWRKQLMMAKDTRRVDILCYRVSLSQKLLAGTKYYKKLYEIVDEAVKKLEADVGHLTGLPVKMARGIVNRLSSGPEVQRLCACAVESLDSMLSKTVRHLSSDHVIEESNLLASNIIQIEDVCTSSVMVVFGSNDPELGNVAGYTLWHRRAENMDYPSEPSGMFTPNTRFLLSGLSPATEYVIKVVFFDSTRVFLGTCEIQVRTDSAENELLNQLNLAVERSESESPVTNCSGLSNPSSVEDETNNIDNEIKNTDKIASAISSDVGNLGDSVSLLDEEGGTGKVNLTLNSSELNIENKCSGEGQTVEEASTDNGSNTHVQTGVECVPFVGSSEAELPVTPCKLENFKDGLGRNGRCKPKDKDVDSGSGREEEPQAGSSSKKRSSERQDKDHSGNGDRDFEHYVKVIRWLECEGHIETTFRQKFLTWYSLRATPQEMRVVKVFVDTLVDDPASLAGQLVDTFSEAISSKRSSVVPSGFCLKLWH